MIVLHEVDANAGTLENFFAERLEKKATIVAKDLGLEKKNAGERRLVNFHAADFHTAAEFIDPSERIRAGRMARRVAEGRRTSEAADSPRERNSNRAAA